MMLAKEMITSNNLQTQIEEMSDWSDGDIDVVEKMVRIALPAKEQKFKNILD